MKRMFIVLLTMVLLVSMVPVNAFAAFDQLLTPEYSLTEVLSYDGQVYITTREDVPIRADPTSKGTILEKLPEGYPVQSVAVYWVHWKNTTSQWIKIQSGLHPEGAWIYSKNLAQHFCQYTALDAYDIEFCSSCGHIRMLRMNNDISDSDIIHLCLAAASMIPVIGNGFDILDGMLSLWEGDYAGASLSLLSAVPFVGIAGNVAKASDTTTTLFKVNETIVTVTRTADNILHLDVVGNSKHLAQSMDRVFDVTQDLRFSKRVGQGLPKGSMAAHHLIPAGAQHPLAKKAREMLAYLEIGINSSENGVYLFTKALPDATGAIHVSRHSDEYIELAYNRVFDAFNSVNGREQQRMAVINALDGLARDLMNGCVALSVNSPMGIIQNCA